MASGRLPRGESLHLASQMVRHRDLRGGAISKAAAKRGARSVITHRPLLLVGVAMHDQGGNPTASVLHGHHLMVDNSVVGAIDTAPIRSHLQCSEPGIPIL